MAIKAVQLVVAAPSIKNPADTKAIVDFFKAKGVTMTQQKSDGKSSVFTFQDKFSTVKDELEKMYPRPYKDGTSIHFGGPTINIQLMKRDGPAIPGGKDGHTLIIRRRPS